MAGARHARGRRPDDIPGEFTVVAVSGTHRDNTRKKYGAGGSRRPNHNRLSKAEKQKILLDARREGHSWREAAKIAGYRSVSGAYEAAQEAIADIPREAADEARSIEMQRLDAIVRANWRSMQLGDTDASMVILKAVESRRRMLGLDLSEPEAPMLDVRVQALMVSMISMSEPEFDVHEDEIERLLLASQRGADRARRTAGAIASGE